ncbi:MAG: DUF2029 domain-containing protein [Gramella sp.]|nr:DUF2029 domain-containing protein [Christiangramia sp.]
MDLSRLQLYRNPILIALSCLAFYFTFAYNLDRTDFIKLIALYGALFFLSFKLIQMQRQNFWFLAGLALLFRLVFLVSLPELSQDYFRFIWDGRLIANGWNPYGFVPDELILKSNFTIPQATELITGMGSLSSGHYSNYAPLNQLVFAIAGWFSEKSIVGAVMIFRLFIILADLGILFFGRKLLKALRLPEHRIFWYLLNPFIIIEMTGNLHFESVMVFFLLLSIYLLHKGKWFLSSVVLGLSISIKLLPLMFLPLLFKYFHRDKTLEISHPERSRRIGSLGKLLAYYLICIGTVLLSFLPFYSAEVISNFMASVGLWFGKFEFNASLYYLVRWVGFQVKGYNIIETAGKILPVITILIILALAFFRKYRSTKQLITNMLFAITAYLLLSTTVHPWYLAIPLMLSVFTDYRYMIAWTALVMLSYFAYSNPDYQESFYLIALEYIIVFGFLIKELLASRHRVLN